MGKSTISTGPFSIAIWTLPEGKSQKKTAGTVLELELEVLLTLVLEVLVTEDEVLLLLVTLVLLVVTLVELVELLVNVLELELLPGNHRFFQAIIRWLWQFSREKPIVLGKHCF